MKTTPHLRSVRHASVDSLADLVGGLKKAVGTKLVRQFRSEVPTALIRRAIDEAEELAIDAGFPHLFLPELAAEQVRRLHATVTQDDHHLQLSTAA